MKSGFNSLHPSVRYLVWSQVTFYIFLGMSILLLPEGLRANSGISYYGISKVTLVPFVLAFVSSALLMTLTITHLPRHSSLLQRIRKYLWLMVVFLLGIMLTPYSINPTFDLTHRVFGSLLFIEQVIFAIWLSVWVSRDWLTRSLVLVQFIAGIVCFLSLIDRLVWMIQAQIVFQVTFGVVLIRSISVLLTSPRSGRGI